ncbi:hypothetical protein I550_3011, partial [Mycobacterium intracellulare 1956]
MVAELVLAFFSGKRTNHERSFGLSASAHRRTDHCGLMSRSSRNRRVIAQAVDKRAGVNRVPAANCVGNLCE